MARQAHKQSMDPVRVQGFHIIQRCVRRAFLCCDDPDSGPSFEHRNRSENDWSSDLHLCRRYFGLHGDVKPSLFSASRRPDVVAA